MLGSFGRAAALACRAINSITVTPLRARAHACVGGGNSDLKASEYSTPVLGLIFLKFADINYRKHEPEILKEFEKLKDTRRERPIAARMLSQESSA